MAGEVGFRLTGSCLEQRDPRLDVRGSFFTGEIKGAQNLRRTSAPGPPKSVPAPSWTEDPRPRSCFSSSQLQCRHLCALCFCVPLLPVTTEVAARALGHSGASSGHFSRHKWPGLHRHRALLPACSGTLPTSPSRRCDIRGVSSRKL